MKNHEIRSAAKQHGVYLWEIADRCGITDSTFSRRLRRELTPEETSRILEIIRAIASEKKGDISL